MLLREILSYVRFRILIALLRLDMFIRRQAKRAQQAIDTSHSNTVLVIAIVAYAILMVCAVSIISEKE